MKNPTIKEQFDAMKEQAIDAAMKTK